MNIIAALGNLSKEWPSALALYLSDCHDHATDRWCAPYCGCVPYFPLYLAGAVWSIIFLVLTKNWFARKEKNPALW